jgi:DNA-binding transcriptional ArsR family regulator
MQNLKLKKAILKQCEDVSALLKSLSHPVRLKILCQLMEKECSVNELTEFCDISQSAMSQFLGRMKEDGIVVSRRDQNFVYYAVADQRLILLLQKIKEIYC